MPMKGEMVMRNMRNRNSTKDWLRLVAKLSLLFTEPKVRAAVGNRMKDRMEDLTDTVSGKYGEVTEAVSDKYDDIVDRLEAAADAFHGRNYWPSRITGFVLGVGVGAGLGILLAPAPGNETRETMRDKATEMKNKIRDSVARMPATGTEG